jgi:hypothetical protein
MIGKPDSGKLNVRFDEGELEIESRLLRQFPTLPRFQQVKPDPKGHWRKNTSFLLQKILFIPGSGHSEDMTDILG